MSRQLEEELKKPEALSIVDLIDKLVRYAHIARASDIHIDPDEDSVRIRLRIDGVLHEKFRLPKTIHQEVISRIKVLSGLRTDEHQAAQDGRFRLVLPEVGAVDVRVSIAPTYFEENAVLRLLSDRAENFDLESLGFSEDERKKIMKAVERPTGMVLATGPTGSGKTTTLYSLLKLLNKEDVAIVTIEDPIEYAISGIEQIQVNPKYGLSFANGLRSILRQDPNIIMVGEIRDAETAGIAVNTALTGHLLLSTLHTNDAPTTLPRLLDMGIEPYLVASTVSVAIGQRLIRKLCECKREKTINQTEAEALNDLFKEGEFKKGEMYYEPVGCKKCGNTGYSGRISVNEVMVMDNELREEILRKSSAEKIRQIAVKNGMKTMLADATLKARAGATSIEEVVRVVTD